MCKKVGIIATILLLICVVKADKQILQEQPLLNDTTAYYASINTSLDGLAFQEQLTDLISDAKELSYGDLWTAFGKTDTIWPSCPPGTVHDMYSTKCWTYQKDQCGNYQREGDCYNREHSWPKSWWNGNDDTPAYTDLHHLFPTDGYDNAMRSNYPMGNILPNSQTYVTNNGCKLGKCDAGSFGSAITCWEVVDEIKGDIARAYFYMSTRYLYDFTCCSEKGVDDAHINSWMEDVLRGWHKLDPVSDVERQRNDIIYTNYQRNRNPFIDHPEWVDNWYK